MDTKKTILANLETLKAKLPDLAKQTEWDRFWGKQYPYTIEDAIEYIKEEKEILQELKEIKEIVKSDFIDRKIKDHFWINN